MLFKVFALCVVLVHAHDHHKKPAGSSSTASPSAAGDPESVSPSGTFRGSWMTTRRGRRFQAYRGIRYAEPPVGELRFKPPKPILQYKGVVDASKEGPACPLVAPPTYYVDEDCLTINVYTPNNKPSKPLPVIFWIHPGGFYSMTGRSDLAGPHYFLDRDVVLVSINYRLGTLGFISTGDAVAPGNNAMKDQVMALRWVQRNIAAFGGDPNLVTLTGDSAGSISVLLHMISPMSQGLFHRGISMSASPINKESLPSHQRHLAVKAAELLDCPTTTSEAILACLKTKPSSELGNYARFFEFGMDPIGLWSPVIEPDFGQERFLDINPLDAIKKGRMQSMPYIISQTTDEFFWDGYNVVRNETLLKRMNEEWETVAPIAFMLPKENRQQAVKRLKDVYLGGKTLVNDEASAKSLGKLYGDSIVGFGVHRLANLMCRYSRHPVWYDEFAYIGQHSHYEDPKTGKPVGAAHHDEMIYLFTLSYRFPTIETTSPDSHMVDKITALWYNFARYGDPNPRGDTPELKSLSWAAMKPQARKYLRIGDKLEVKENMFEDRFKVWEELYPIQY